MAGTKYRDLDFRDYFTRRVGWHWEVWFRHSDHSPDPNNGAVEWQGSSVKFWRWINAERAALDLLIAFQDGIDVQRCRQYEIDDAKRDLAIWFPVDKVEG